MTFKLNVSCQELSAPTSPFTTIPISPDTSDIQYVTGIAVYRTGPFGPVYGHGGWIPGYSSSLRHYTEHGITIAFQLNTDIGIDDESMQLIKNMEIRLAKIVITAVRK
jgi:D-alanyl-D-alanine carboxypeptidase